MKLIIDEICNTFETRWKDHVVRTFAVEGDTMEDCFRKAYPSERSLRYCSGYRIRFRDAAAHEAYQEWKQNGLTMEMFYGSATVD